MLSRQRLVADKHCCTVPTWSQKFEEHRVGTQSSSVRKLTVILGNFHEFLLISRG